MALRVDEIMNPELFSLRPTDDADMAMGHVLALGISGAPVVDGQGQVVGMVSWRDLIARRRGRTVADRMTTPAITALATEPIRDAARRLCELGLHRVVVVDEAGHAVGMLSSVDALKALLGLPVGHPATFPHFDRSTGLTWTDPSVLDLDALGAAPDGPGVLMLIHGGPGVPEETVRTEWCRSVRGRLQELLSRPQTETPELERLLRMKGLRFRAAGTSAQPHAT